MYEQISVRRDDGDVYIFLYEYLFLFIIQTKKCKKIFMFEWMVYRGVAISYVYT